MVLPPELVQQVRRLQLKARRIARADLAGEYHSAFKGTGLLFDDVREYQPGDDIRRIDWNVTARLGSPFIKRFVEERELTVLLVVDWSASMQTGTGVTTKKTVAAELAALVTLTAATNNDRVGYLGVTNRIECAVRPNKGPRHTLRVLRDLLFFQPVQKQTDLRLALEYILRSQKKRAIVFVLSDFQGEGFADLFQRVGRKHDTTAVVIRDNLEEKLPQAGLVRWQDAETGRQILTDTSSKAFQDAYTKRVVAKRNELNRLFAQSKIDVIQADTSGQHVNALVASFRKRSRA